MNSPKRGHFHFSFGAVQVNASFAGVVESYA
jgi:hypothetical protein